MYVLLQVLMLEPCVPLYKAVKESFGILKAWNSAKQRISVFELIYNSNAFGKTIISISWSYLTHSLL